MFAKICAIQSQSGYTAVDKKAATNDQDTIYKIFNMALILEYVTVAPQTNKQIDFNSIINNSMDLLTTATTYVE